MICQEGKKWVLSYNPGRRINAEDQNTIRYKIIRRNLRGFISIPFSRDGKHLWLWKIHRSKLVIFAVI
ncbi:hypothetical protein F0562_008079 [Nyssa sinensis]|uniref:Uncharacterized protein n=1 Tax=Nyssa sinensis TaxID=561372 RepID=A0A5J5A8I6_9ASTE|nr:hypothetical protein F0562_008079 [Nyssa sinensis]